MLVAIERDGGYYGMKLKKKKCEAMCIRGRDRNKFADGTLVPTYNEAKYLGCMINDKGETRKSGSASQNAA